MDGVRGRRVLLSFGQVTEFIYPGAEGAGLGRHRRVRRALRNVRHRSFRERRRGRRRRARRAPRSVLHRSFREVSVDTRGMVHAFKWLLPTRAASYCSFTRPEQHSSSAATCSPSAPGLMSRRSFPTYMQCMEASESGAEVQRSRGARDRTGSSLQAS